MAPTTDRTSCSQRDRLADHRPGHHDRRGDPQVRRRDRRRSTRTSRRRTRRRRAGRLRRPAPPPGRPGHTRRRSSSCSPTAPTPAASSPSRRPAIAGRARGAGLSRSASAPANPTPMVCTADQLGGRGFDGPARRLRAGGGRGPGGGNFLVADEATLQRWPSITGGEYFAAADADQLQGVLNDLPRHGRDPAARRRGQRRRWPAWRRCCCCSPCGRRRAGRRSRPDSCPAVCWNTLHAFGDRR